MKLVIAAILLVTGHVRSAPQCTDVPANARLDCNPDNPISEEVCLKRGCCWASSLSKVQAFAPGKPPLGVPACFYGPEYVGYEVKSVESSPLKTLVVLERKQASGYVKDVQTLNLEISHINDNTVRIKFFDPKELRYEVPVPKLNIEQKSTVDKPLYKVNVDKTGKLEVVRVETSVAVFKTDLRQLVFSDQFLQLTSGLPSDAVYGLGEHKDSFRKSAKQWKRITFFNRDISVRPNQNIYGSHPFYLSAEDIKGHSNGVFLFNSNAMDVILQPKPAITWRTIGGILDFYVFLGPQPSDVIRQYNNLIGLPHLPPYWAFGFQLCKYVYPKGLEGMIAVFNRTRAAGIPYDVQWNDIDAMDNHLDFTHDPKLFAKLPEFVEELHKVGMKYIPMFDPGISPNEKAGTYKPFDLGLKMDIFVKNETNQPFVGKVWPGNTVFPDFTHPKAAEYWTELFSDYHKTVAFDGSWIDMNEPSSFGSGSVYGCPNNSLENPQYTPGPGSDDLKQSTLCMNAKQAAGVHYNVHNLYGFTEAIATNRALKTVLQKRPVIISRSTFVGHGHYAGHWDGDITSSWDHMRWTIPSILNMNMFGIPFIGADICGFIGDTSEELCARWSALGAFYPFSRNHNADNAREQDPAVLGPTVTAAAKNALEWKYSLLPYLYTLFYKANTTGDTVVRPLFFEFATDAKSYEVETQFLWGPALMIVPTLEEKATKVDAYLPPGVWYDWKTHSTYESKGQTYSLDSPLTDIKLFVRSGHVLVTQQPKVTTEETRKGNFELLVALDTAGTAEGSLYWDAGDGLDTIALKRYSFVQLSARNNTLMTSPTASGYDLSGQHLSSAVVLGVKSEPKSVTVDGSAHNDFKYDKQVKQLTINGLKCNLLSKNTIQWKE